MLSIMRSVSAVHLIDVQEHGYQLQELFLKNGGLSNNMLDNCNGLDIRQMAEKNWTDASINYRTDLQETLMRKMNAGKWQQRVAPISTGGQRMLGGMSLR